MSKRLVPLAGLVVVGVVLAGSVMPGRTLAVPGGSYTFLYTGSEQTYPVAPNLTGLHVVLVGAAGAEDTTSNLGGWPAKMTVDLPLPAETSTLYVEVGGAGLVDTGGWNGGGGGPFGGGGASDIRTVSCGVLCATGGDTASLDSRLAVANGGGGASDDQDGGVADSTDLNCTLCGAFGTGSAGGAAVPQATVTSLCQGLGDMNGEPGSDGSLGLGGAAATFLLTGPEDGGGGGGWYGGGGGAQCYDTGAVATVNAGSGGAGSSAAPTGSYVFNPADISDPSEVIITAPVPTATSAPTVAGGLTVGDLLSESHGQWSSGMPLTGYGYQWERCNASGADCTAITGATGQTHALVKADLGDTIRVEESGENFYGSSASPATSAATSVVGEVPMATARPAVVGKPVQGEQLLESHATWSDGPITSYGYQWERCSGGRCAAIPGAVHDTYRPTKSDVGSTIKVRETATNAYGTSAPAASAATSKVQSAATAKAASLTLLGAPTASASGVSFSVRCTATGGRACRGSAQFTTLEHRLGDKIVGLMVRAKQHSKRVLVGSMSFRLAAGARKRIHVPLDGRGVKLLARFHRIPATLTITLLNTTPHTRIAARTTIES